MDHNSLGLIVSEKPVVDSTQSYDDTVMEDELDDLSVFPEAKQDPFLEIPTSFVKVKSDGLLLRIIPSIQLKQITYGDFMLLLCIATEATQRTYRIYTTARSVAATYKLAETHFSVAIRRLINAGILARNTDSKGIKYFVIDPDILSTWNNPRFYAAAKKEIDKKLKEVQEYVLSKK